MSVPDKLGLVGGEILQDQRCQVSIFTQVQQVLEMQRVDPVLRVLVNDLIRDKKRLVRIRRSQSVD